MTDNNNDSSANLLNVPGIDKIRSKLNEIGQQVQKMNNDINAQSREALQKSAERIAKEYEKLPGHMKTSAEATAVLARKIVDKALAGRERREAEIVAHYLSGSKYGMAGSNGSVVSNYIRHTLNNHEFLSLFFADKRNAFDKRRRFLVLFSKLSLTYLLSAAILLEGNGDDDRINIDLPINISGQSFLLSLLLIPYGSMLTGLAECRFCNENNVCVCAAVTTGYCILVTIALVSLLYIGIAIVITQHISDGDKFAELFFYAIMFDYLSYFYYGITNWILRSWRGFLIIPIFPCGFPPQFLPILGIWPIPWIMQLYYLGESTYHEDKVDFINQYPGRKAIDDFPAEYYLPNVTTDESDTNPLHEGTNYDSRV